MCFLICRSFRISIFWKYNSDLDRYTCLHFLKKCWFFRKNSNVIIWSSGETHPPQASTSTFQPHYEVPASQSHQRGTYVTEDIIDGVKYYFCPICGVSSAVKSNVLRHIRTVHGPNQNLTCQNCGSIYKNVGSLREHQRKKICGQILTSSKLSNLNWDGRNIYPVVDSVFEFSLDF